MHLQQPNTYAGGKKLTIQQEFLLASELFIDDVFLIRKRERRLLLLASALIILFLVLSAGLVLWIRRGNDNRSILQVPAARPATATLQHVNKSVKTAAADSPRVAAGHSLPEQSTSGESFSPQSSHDNSRAKRNTAGASRTPRPLSRAGRQQLASLPKPPTSLSDTTNRFDRSTFYMSADARRSGSRQRTSRYSGKSTPSPSPVSNKDFIVANIAQLHGGQLKKTLEHNGDYYKLKLVIPEKRLLQFKKDLAKLVEYASYSTISRESDPENTCFILETHFR